MGSFQQLVSCRFVLRQLWEALARLVWLWFLRSVGQEVAMLSPVSFGCAAFVGIAPFKISALLSCAEMLLVRSPLLQAAAAGADAPFLPAS